MRWYMDTHKYMSEITRKALQIMVAHGITTESEPEQIDKVERELGESGIYKNYEAAKGRVRRALFTYFKAYGCLNAGDQLTELGKAFVENKLSIQEFSFCYVVNYLYKDEEWEYYPLELILKFFETIRKVAPNQSFMTPYDFSRIVECNSTDEISTAFVSELIEARKGETIEVNERGIGYDIWQKMLVQAGILSRNSDKYLIEKNNELSKWILQGYEKGLKPEPGKICTGILTDIPVLTIRKQHGDIGCFSKEGKSLQAFLFDSVDDLIVDKYIYECDDYSYAEMLNMLGLDSSIKGYYRTFSGVEHVVGFSLIENSNDRVRVIGNILLSLPVIAVEEVDEDEEQEDRIDEIDEIDEYKRAAMILKRYCEMHPVTITERTDIDISRDDFVARFGPDVLSDLSDDELLNRMFYTQGDNTNSLCCWLEMNKECRSYFGGIAGGSAYKFGLFQKQENGTWQTGSAPKPIELDYDSALERGKEIREALVEGCRIIENATLETKDDYENLDDTLKERISNDHIYYNWTWFHKYFSILFPEKLSSYHSNEFQYHVLRCFGIRPSDKFYGRSGQISMIQRRGGWIYRQFSDIMNARFGGIKQFLRIGSSDENKGYASEWKQGSVVGIGWPRIGSLEDYKDEDGRMDKEVLSERLSEIYYPQDARTASRKAGELIRFYESNNDSVFVVMEGEKLIGLVDEVGGYRYDESTNMANMKSGRWHLPFRDDDHLPDKSEGLRTSCVQIRNEDNLLFLYQKYYYEDDNLDEEEGVEKALLKNCLEIQLNPRTVKTHPMNFIIYGAPGTGKTYSTAEYALAVIENREADLSKKTVEERKAIMARYNALVRQGRIVFTTFHQSYGYEEFIQGLRPDTTSEKMAFKTVDGVFKHIADVALNDGENNYVIIIDEINRANISKVFGELITLIEEDKRWGELNETSVTLQSGDVFAVPNNLYIIGTMNSADKSISLIDAALRRRFDFVEQKPEPNLIEDPKLRELLTKMNTKLADELDSSDLLIGHSYFMDKSEASLPSVLNSNIIPLLYEYFYDNKKKVANVLDYSIGGVNIEIVDDKLGRLSVKKKDE